MSQATRLRHRGFALLVVLVVMAILSAVLATAVRSGTRDSAEVHRQVQALQTRWTTTSAGQTLGRQLPIILDPTSHGSVNDSKNRKTKRTPTARAESRFTIQLPTVTLDLVATDEQAKINLNRIDPADVESRAGLMWLLNRDERLKSALRLRPYPEALLQVVVSSTSEAVPKDINGNDVDSSFEDRGEDERVSPYSEEANSADLGPESQVLSPPGPPAEPLRPRFASYGQLFAGVPPRELVGNKIGSGLASHLTVYGDGRMHWASGSQKTVYAALLPEVGQQNAAMLAALANKAPKPSWEEMMTRIEGMVALERLEEMQAILTPSSDCRMLWVFAAPGGGGPERAAAWVFDCKGRARETIRW